MAPKAASNPAPPSVQAVPPIPMVISRAPDTFTLPVALLNLNGELGVNVQGIMALAVLTTLPTTLVFLAAQKRVMSGMADGAVKG